MPIVTSRPTNSMTNTAMPLLPLNIAMLFSTKGWISPVAFITAANPWAAIIIKPTIAIILIPSPKTSLAAFRLMTPSIMNTAKPTIAPKTSAS